MQKLRIILYLLCLLSLVSLTSCSKVSKFNNYNYGKIKYYVAGIYFQVDEYEEFSLDDPNPKIYFDFSSKTRFGTLSTTTGTKTSAAMISDISKNNKVENGVNKYYMTASIKFVNSNVKKVKLYLIYIDNEGKFSINEEVSESINLSNTSSYNFITDFVNNKNKYQIQMKLLFK